MYKKQPFHSLPAQESSEKLKILDLWLLDPVRRGPFTFAAGKGEE